MADTIAWEKTINGDALESMSLRQLELLESMLSPFSSNLIGTVRDGVHAVGVYRAWNGFVTCDNMPARMSGLMYWDYYSDLISFACDYNPQIDIEGAWIEGPDGLELIDDFDED